MSVWKDFATDLQLELHNLNYKFWLSTSSSGTCLSLLLVINRQPFNMLDRNSIIIGLLIGFLLPFVGYAILLTLFEGLESMGWVSGKGFSSNFRERTMGIVAIALNVYPLNVFLKRRFTNSMRGIVIATTVYVVTWLLMYANVFF